MDGAQLATHAAFADLVSELQPALERLQRMAPVRGGEGLPRDRVPGVYLFSEAGHPLYVGRTNDLRGRYARHCRPGATWRMAAFAFRLAREATGRLKATYRAGEGSQRALAAEPKFAAAFTAAKASIRAMDFRYVEEARPVHQCILEVYCALALGTPYNDFDNH